MHYSLPPVVGGVEAVIRAQAELFIQSGYPVRLIGGRGDKNSLPVNHDIVLFPELDSLQPEIREISKSLERGIVPANYQSLRDRIEATLEPVVADLDHLIVHNVLTKHFNLPLTDAIFRLLDNGSINHLIGWCHDFTWTSPNSRSKVHNGYPWDLLRTYREDIDYVVVSGQRQRDLADLFGCNLEEIRVVYNGVDWSVLLGISNEGRQLIQRLELLDRNLLLIMPVRVTQAKNIEYALDVLQFLCVIEPGSCLVLTGPPDPHDPESRSYYQSLKNRRHQLGLDDHMYFVYDAGTDPNQPYLIDEKTLGDLFRLCDVMFMPSHREGFGMPVLESGLLGILAVTTDVPAAKEIAAQDAIIFNKNQSAEETAKMIIEQVNKNEISRLKRRIRKEYTWQAIFMREIVPLIEKG
jgi:glycosyltransferase involved in cell wall biosynthesis